MVPLAGLRIVVTRAVHQAGDLAEPLRLLGAEVILLPMIGIAPPADLEPLRNAALHANDYDWIIFTSQNSVNALAAHLSKSKRPRFRVAAIGRATREVAEQAGFDVDLVPEKYVAESLLEAFDPEDLNGKRILIPSAAVTRDVIPGELRNRGAIVTLLEAYRNVLPAGSAEQAKLVFHYPFPDWVLFASPSAVDNLASIVSPDILKQVKAGTIGPVTSEAVAKWGIRVAAEAQTHDVEGLVRAVVDHDQAEGR